MGSTKKIKYGVLGFNLDMTTRTVKEKLNDIAIDKSCSLAMDLVDLACNKVKSAIIQRMEIDCEQIAQDMHELMKKYIESGVDQFEYPDNLPGNIKFFKTPKVEGGDNYNVHLKTADKKETIECNVIRVGVGVNYKSYYSNYVRTLFVSPTRKIEVAYTFTVIIKRLILYYLRDGVELCKIFKGVMLYAEKQSEELTRHLQKEFGFSLSPILEDDLVIKSKTRGIAKYGMTFSINVNLIDLKEGDRVYNICSSDTVLVRKNDPAEMLTSFQRSQFISLIQVNN